MTKKDKDKEEACAAIDKDKEETCETAVEEEKETRANRAAAEDNVEGGKGRTQQKMQYSSLGFFENCPQVATTRAITRNK